MTIEMAAAPHIWDPPVAAAMLGPRGSGKTTFLVAAQAAFGARGGGPTLRAERPADHARLRSAWAELGRAATYPPPDTAPSDHSILLGLPDGTDIPARVDDHRGALLDEPGESMQAEILTACLAQAEIVLVTVDGAVLAAWSPAAGAARIVGDLRLSVITGLVLRATAMRRAQGLRPPLLALIVTKADSVAGSAHTPMASMPRLAPIAFGADVTTLVCRVSAVPAPGGALVAGTHLAPFAFAALVRLGRRRTELAARLGRALQPGTARPGSAAVTIAMQRELVEIRGAVGQLVGLLDDCGVYRDGKPIAAADLAGGREIERRIP
ncbi:hypothetical protein [Nocardia bovistercoris]|uniref:Uncharacterized protein n=1 Tax=Nocardia bovistercoris TaxID=2785916 RepID=A0A931I821_9NOCA|nr:hypothetical protein [Nocardia bovistercoris]MBH0776579.1 hypothetical protein [Nocardia bovistercoris]